jgi:ketosteroid isomerase-like protein
MSEENVGVVRVAYEAFARDGLDRFLEYFTDDVEYYVLAGGGSLELGLLHGTEAVRAWLQDWIDMFDDFRMELVEVIDAGEITVFTEERYGGCARLSRVEMDQANWTVFTVREGKIARGREYWTRDEALEAAGSSE